MLFHPAVPRTPPRNIQVYRPTPNSLNVRWEPASGQVQQYRVDYAPLTGVRPSEFVSFILFLFFFYILLCQIPKCKEIQIYEIFAFPAL